jgi:hypothetical protein
MTVSLSPVPGSCAADVDVPGFTRGLSTTGRARVARIRNRRTTPPTRGSDFRPAGPASRHATPCRWLAVFAALRSSVTASSSFPGSRLVTRAAAMHGPAQASVQPRRGRWAAPADLPGRPFLQSIGRDAILVRHLHQATR